MKRQYKYLVSFVNANWTISRTYVYAESKHAAQLTVRKRFKHDYKILTVNRVNVTDPELFIDCYKIAGGF